MTWFILSLIAILFWSGSDLFSKLGSRPDDKYSHWKMVMAVGVVMGAHAFFLIATPQCLQQRPVSLLSRLCSGTWHAP